MPLGQITEALLALYPDVNMTDKLADVSAMLRIEIDREEDGRWIGEVPELPGVLAYGATEAEARSKVTALAFRVIAERMPKLLITDEYRALNAALHASNPSYGTSGQKWAAKVHRLARQYGAETVLDYGAGKGTLHDALMGIDRQSYYEFIEYDPGIPRWAHRPDCADFVVCGDVLEHIEPECLDAVLDDLRDLARKAVLLIVATRPAAKTLADGRNTHLIVEPPEWWFPKLAQRWRIREFQDRGGFFVCVGEAR